MGGKNGLWTRREFLVLSAGATGGLLITACSPAADPATSTTIASTVTAPASTVTTTSRAPVSIADYWSLLRETQRRIRTSPDHVAATLADLSQAGDLAGLTEYVRDHIAVIPGDPAAWISVGQARRWGTRGVKRSRMGTPREVAELVADVLNEAGIEATVVRGMFNGSERPLLVPVPPAPATVDEPPEDLFAAAGTSRGTRDRTADPTVAAAMAAAALAALDPASFDPKVTSELFGFLPEVRVGDQLAGIWNRDPGPYEADGSNSPLGDAFDTPEATFTLSIATDLDTRNPVEVATARFRLEDLAGRSVKASFVPPADSLMDLFTTRPADVTTVIPTLSIAGVDLSNDERAEFTVQGEAFTIEGSRLTDDDDGLTLNPSSVPGEGEPPVGRIRSDADPTTAAEISIRRVVAAHYPKLTVEVEVVDANGDRVEGLGADQFLIADDGYEVPFNLRRSERPAPSVVFIVDNSTSVPEQWRGQGAVRVVTEIATAVKAEHQDARFRIANVGLEGAGLLRWTTDPEKVGREADQFGIGSALWDSYVDAAVPGANAIVFLTDGISVTETADNIENEAPDDLIPQLLAAPPAIMLGSGELGGAFQAIADFTGGIALPIEDQDAGIAAVLEQLERNLQPYDILVLADEANGATERTVSVAMPAAGLQTTATFAVPERPTVGRALGGIYLTIQSNTAIVHRTLAGVPYRSGQEVTPEIAQEVRQALFGKYAVITEAGAPSPSQILDDTIAGLLSLQPVWEAESADEALAALADSEEIPHGAFTFALPISGAGDTLTWETGLRMWLSSERTIPAGDVDVLRRSVDLLPNGRFVTTTVEDPAESVRITAARTASLAAIEAALFDESAATDVSGGLTELNLSNTPPEDRQAYDSIVRGWPGAWRFAFNSNRSAATAADPRSGGLIAVLGDGTGGGITEEEIRENFDQAISLTELAGAAGFKAWANLEKAKLEKLKFATIVIHRMSVEGIIDLIEEEVCSRVEGAASGWASGAVGAAGGAVEGLIEGYGEAADIVSDFGDATGLGPTLPTEIPLC